VACSLNFHNKRRQLTKRYFSFIGVVVPIVDRQDTAQFVVQTFLGNLDWHT
jgi:hypothetical protein